VQSGGSPYKDVLTHPTCKFVQFESPSNIMTSDIIDRIIANRYFSSVVFLVFGFVFPRSPSFFRSLEYQARNDKKNQKELDIIKIRSENVAFCFAAAVVADSCKNYVCSTNSMSKIREANAEEDK
jgi:hypothetical protein